MKFLLFSECGEGAQILKRIEIEGNEVGLFVREKEYKTVWDGLLPKVEPDEFIDKDTIILFDMSGNGSIADSYKRKGHFVYGASAFADDLEHDRKFGFDAMTKSGILIPNYKEFTALSEGQKYVREANKRLVFKPSGTMPCKLTYVSRNAEELLAYMSFVERQFGKHIESFILQEFVEGAVVSTEYFCDGTRFIGPPNHTVEVKKSMNDDLGPSTGCSGNIVWPCEEDLIVQKGVALVEEFCVTNNYVGQIDLNAVVNDTGVYGLEWTPRFGYDATPTLLSLFTGDFGKFFSDICHRQCNAVPAEDSYAGGVRLTIPPYPAEPREGTDPEKLSPSMGVPILDYENYEASCYFYEVAERDGVLVHSGGTGVILCATGAGSTPSDALGRPYEVVENITVPDKQYRTDLRKVLVKMTREVESYA